MAKKVDSTKKTTAKKVVKKKESKNEILKKLKDPKTTDAERVKLMDKLYEDIEVRKKK